MCKKHFGNGAKGLSNFPLIGSQPIVKKPLPVAKHRLKDIGAQKASIIDFLRAHDALPLLVK